MTNKLIAGNWKMNGGLATNAALVEVVRAGLPANACRVAVCVPAPYLAQVQGLVAGAGQGHAPEGGKDGVAGNRHGIRNLWIGGRIDERMVAARTGGGPGAARAVRIAW